MEIEPLALREYFAAVSDADWSQSVPDELDWQPLEGFRMRPHYRRSSRTFAHVSTRAGWRLRLNGHASMASELFQYGATAIGIESAADLPEARLSEILRAFKDKNIPCFFECAGKSNRVLSRLKSAARSLDLQAEELQGAVALHATRPMKDHEKLLNAANGTSYKTIQINLLPWHRAGADAAQELAAATGLLAHTMASLGATSAAPRIYFTMPVGTRYLMAIAKMRALRHLARLVYKAFGVPTGKIVIEGVPSPRHQTTLDEDTHLVRITLQCMAAAIGGCDIITVDGPAARRIPLIMQHEAAMDQAIDPAAGAWYIEEMTDKLARAAWKLFQKIESMGGFFAAESWLGEQIAASANDRMQHIRNGRQTFVGVNRYPDLSQQAQPHMPGSGRLAEPFEALRMNVQSLVDPLAITLLTGPPEATSWIKRVLACAGLTPQAASKKSDLSIAFSLAQAEKIKSRGDVIVVLDQPPESSPEWPVLVTGGDFVTAAELVLDMATR